MLYPAQLYKDELRRKLIECWYNPKYSYYFCGEYHEFSVPDNTEWRQDFVHLDKEGNVDGFFSFNYNQSARSMSNFGLISFADDGTALVIDAINLCKKMFKNGARRAEFWAFADNPVCKLYDKIIKRFNGTKCGYLHDTSFFDGKYHDTVFYEIMNQEIINK
jgi:hypothetical protein